MAVLRRFGFPNMITTGLEYHEYEAAERIYLTTGNLDWLILDSRNATTIWRYFRMSTGKRSFSMPTPDFVCEYRAAGSHSYQPQLQSFT